MRLYIPPEENYSPPEETYGPSNENYSPPETAEENNGPSNENYSQPETAEEGINTTGVAENYTQQINEIEKTHKSRIMKI